MQKPIIQQLQKSIDEDDINSYNKHIHELASIIENCEIVINDLLDFIATSDEEYYSSSDNILKADTMLKWINNETRTEETKEFFNYPPSTTAGKQS